MEYRFAEHSTHTNKLYNKTEAVILTPYKYENLYNKNELIKTSIDKPTLRWKKITLQKAKAA